MARDRVPKDETPEQKFTRMASTRVSNVLEQLTVLGQMGQHVPSGPAGDAATSRAFGAIREAYDAALKRWQERTPGAKTRLFTLDSGTPNPNQTEIPAATAAAAAAKKK